MPWIPELFSAPVVQQVLDRRRRDELVAMPYFDGLLAGEPGALLDSFAGEPELYDPVAGRVKGVAAFQRYVTDTIAWLSAHHVSVEDVDHVVFADRGFEEVLLYADGPDGGRVRIPFAVFGEHPADGLLTELRLYYSTWPLTGRHSERPPLRQPDPSLRVPDVVAEYQHACAAGDGSALAAMFEPDGFLREPEGEHRGHDAVRALCATWFAGGGVALEPCGLTDDGRSCAVEYAITAPSASPQAAAIVYERGADGLLASVRCYDDVVRRSQP